MKSMTGFGRSEVDAPFGKWIVEVQSVNRKYLEVYVNLPKEFARFEMDVRKLIGDYVHRGTITARFHLIPNVAAALLPDVELLKNLKKGWERLANSLGYTNQTIDFSFLVQNAAQMPPVKIISEEDFEPVEKGLQEALKELEAMKEKEGSALGKDILSRLKTMSQMVHEIEKSAPGAIKKMREKLKEKMDEVCKPGSELDERLMREVAIYAERLDISEEITRFRSHVAQYTELLQSKEPSGRKMDFLVQEMGREINTMGSKSMDAMIAKYVVELKSELEKVREQVQNIE